MQDIGLFPLGIVVLPGERAALHIFEPRYKDLIGKCLEDERDFGIVLTDAAGMRQIGTLVSVVEVLERFEDGRINVVVEGNDRFELVEVKDERSYLTADTEPFEDSEELPGPEAYEACLTEYRRVVTAASLDLEEPAAGYRGLAFQIAAQIELASAAKQQILELRSEVARLAQVQDLLKEASNETRRKMIEHRASTNGHVHLP